MGKFDCTSHCNEFGDLDVPMTTNHLHISDLILKLYSFFTFSLELLPLNAAKSVPYH